MAIRTQENPQPPGPWDPVIRTAFIRLRDILGPVPDPWRVFGPLPDPWLVSGPGPQPWKQAFGPSPQPWRLAAILVAEEVVNHVSRLQDFADVTQSEPPAPAAVSEFVDDIELCPPYRKWPFPPPKRGETLFDPAELIIMGAAFEHLAETVFNERLRGGSTGAGAKLVDKGMSKM